jgi:hypothetical protein
MDFYMYSVLWHYEETYYMYLTSPTIYITVYSFLYGLCIGMLILTYWLPGHDIETPARNAKIIWE